MFHWSSMSWSAIQAVAAPMVALAVVAAASPMPRPASDLLVHHPVPAQPDTTTELAAAAPNSVVEPLEGRATSLEQVAVTLAHDLRAVPADETERLCPRSDLEVRWTTPNGFSHGAYLAPIGPRPDASTANVNGVVVCGTSTWAFMGFEATWADDHWNVTAVPYVEEEGHEHGGSLNLDADHQHDHDHHGDDAAPTIPVPNPSAPTAEVETSQWLAGLGPIEPYATYEPQTTCSPTAKAGTIELRDALLGTHPVTRNLGIARACHIGGRSEHKEGRAFDWGAYAHRPVERAAVERFLTQLLATDADGNRHALARRLGVMYVIWDGEIWSAYRANEGWRTYSGPSPHTDHVHISLTWNGGFGRTSFFTLDLVEKGVLGLVPPGGEPLPTGTVEPVSDPTPVADGGPEDATERDESADTDEAPEQRDPGPPAREAKEEEDVRPVRDEPEPKKKRGEDDAAQNDDDGPPHDPPGRSGDGSTTDDKPGNGRGRGKP